MFFSVPMMSESSRIVAFVVLVTYAGLSSCFPPPRGSYTGTPNGWDKNSNNPHHQKSTNTGRGHDKNK